MEQLPRHPRFVLSDTWGSYDFGYGDLTERAGVVEPTDQLQWYETRGPPHETMEPVFIPSLSDRKRVGDTRTWKDLNVRFV